MVGRLLAVLVFLAPVSGVLAQENAEKPAGPVLYGDGGGRIWKWEAGEKTWLTEVGLNLTLGGAGERSLWGWAREGARARFFELELPAPESDPSKPASLSRPVFDPLFYPVPDRADRVGARVLLVYGSREGHLVCELWRAGVKAESKAWDDGRSVYALALGPEEGWLLAGRLADGSPWLEVSGESLPAPEGWRGRLTVAVWVTEPQEEGAEKGEAAAVRPWAAGWGAAGSETPRPLFWGPEGWIQLDSGAEDAAGGIYPVLGAAGDLGAPVLAGWRSDEGTGVLRPWFWTGESALVPGGSADGQPQAFSVQGESGPFLIVRHQSAPWFTKEDGVEGTPLDGLDEGDRVVAVGPESGAPGAKASP